MIIAIQCASTKSPDAGYLHTGEGQSVAFVANPELAPPDGSVLWAHPDGPSDLAGVSWRQHLVDLGPDEAKARGLLPAYQLYAPGAYRRLVDFLGKEQVYVLSAGWGLVRADYPLPAYDITFSAQADAYKRRRSRDVYRDFMQVQPGQPGPLVFLGGKDYLPLFRSLARNLPMPKVVMFRSDPADTAARPREEGGWTYVPFPTDRKTNWHYAAVGALCKDASSVLGT